MAFAEVTWEISDGGRTIEIREAVRQALRPFTQAAPLLSHTVVFGGGEDIDEIRNALDGVAQTFPGEFFYTSATFQGSQGDLQGAYPPSADLGGAQGFTGDSRNPLQRSPLAVVAAARAERPVAAIRSASGRSRPGGRVAAAARGRKKGARRRRIARPKRGSK